MLIRKNKINKATDILSYREIEKRRVLDVQKKAEIGDFLKRFLKRSFRKSFRKLGQALVNWKLQRMRRRALKAENTENGSMYKVLIQKLSFEKLRLYTRRRLASSSTCRSGPTASVGGRFFKNIIKGLKGKMGSKVLLKKGLAFITIVAVIVTAYWQGTPQTPLEI